MSSTFAFQFIDTIQGGYEVYMVPLNKLRQHEEHSHELSEELARNLTNVRLLRQPLIVEKDDLILLDGHHRMNALMNYLGAIYAPCVLIGYNDPRLSIGSWRENDLVTRERVRDAAWRQRLLPRKTSRHAFDPPIGEIPIDIASLRQKPAVRPIEGQL